MLMYTYYFTSDDQVIDFAVAELSKYAELMGNPPLEKADIPEYFNPKILKKAVKENMTRVT